MQLVTIAVVNAPIIKTLFSRPAPAPKQPVGGVHTIGSPEVKIGGGGGDSSLLKDSIGTVISSQEKTGGLALEPHRSSGEYRAVEEGDSSGSRIDLEAGLPLK